MSAALLPLLLWSVIGCLVFYSLYLLYGFYLDAQKKSEKLAKIVGQAPHPLWGNVHVLPGPSEEGLKWVREGTKTVTRLGKFWFGPFNLAVSVIHPETVKVIFKTSEPKSTGSIGGYRFAAPWLGHGLILAGGERWARNRRLLTPAFHFDILRPYMAINNQASEILLDKMASYAESGKPFELFSQVSLFTLDVVLRCAFSYVCDCQIQGETHPYVKAVSELSEGVIDRMLNPFIYPDFIYFLTPTGRKFKKNCDFVHAFADQIIHKRRLSLAENNNAATGERLLDFLDILLTCRDADGKGLSDLEIREEADTFLFAGHDTTASGISWTLSSLARHPQYLAKCQKEVDDILDGRASDEITWEDLSRMKYLTQCIKESLRLNTPVPFIERQLTRDMVIDGITIPKGTIVDIVLYALHHNPQCWPDSTVYNPDRFSPENLQAMDSFAFAPFSAGPRNCIGQHFAMHEMKTAIARIIRRFDLQEIPSKPAKRFVRVVMKSEKGIFVKLTRRLINQR